MGAAVHRRRIQLFWSSSRREEMGAPVTWHGSRLHCWLNAGCCLYFSVMTHERHTRMHKQGLNETGTAGSINTFVRRIGNNNNKKIRGNDVTRYLNQILSEIVCCLTAKDVQQDDVTVLLNTCWRHNTRRCYLTSKQIESEWKNASRKYDEVLLTMRDRHDLSSCLWSFSV